MRKNLGITLIALIITIVVLLILAGVSISIVTGDNGILTQAQDSKVKTDKAHIQEIKDLTAARAAMNLDGYTYTDKNNVSVYIPSDFAVSENPDEQTVEDGLVVIDKMGDEFVWVPVKSDGSDFIRRSSINDCWPHIINTFDDYGENLWLKEASSSNDLELNIVKESCGYYVSRYEIGINSCERDDEINYYENTEIPEENDAKEYWKNVRDNNNSKYKLIKSILPTLNSKKGMEPIRNITQEESLALANSWKEGKDYQSGLMSGRTWDSMVEFMAGYSSGSLDNWKCAGVSKQYSSIFVSKGENNIGWGKLLNWSSDGIGKIIFETGGFVSANGNLSAKKNIFDVAGNVWEQTTEICDAGKTRRILRGGLDATFARKNNCPIATTEYFRDVGFRVVIYVKNPSTL